MCVFISAGIGRTGVFAIISMVISRIKQYGACADILPMSVYCITQNALKNLCCYCFAYCVCLCGRFVWYAGVEVEVDIMEMIRMIRMQRSGMVQTDQQYKFIYSTIACYVDNFVQPSNKQRVSECCTYIVCTIIGLCLRKLNFL